MPQPQPHALHLLPEKRRCVELPSQNQGKKEEEEQTLILKSPLCARALSPVAFVSCSPAGPSLCVAPAPALAPTDQPSLGICTLLRDVLVFGVEVFSHCNGSNVMLNRGWA
ncbi:hypothetical protein NL676_019540 [Syzygium grande]|nr:hypothetical protein NL676_019540 [Syzygium grande]